MPNYQKMYTTLFNAITDALEELDRANFGVARQRLIRAPEGRQWMWRYISPTPK